MNQPIEVRRGDVFFCQGSLDGADWNTRKTRPVVVISNDAGNTTSPKVIVVNMTTNVTRRLYPMHFDIVIPGRGVSRVHCEEIRTVEKADLIDRIYSLTPEEVRRLDHCLAWSLGMAPEGPQTSQEAPRDADNTGDDLFHRLARKGLSAAVIPLPLLNQVNVTITDGGQVNVTRNFTAGIMEGIRHIVDVLDDRDAGAEEDQ